MGVRGVLRETKRGVFGGCGESFFWHLLGVPMRQLILLQGGINSSARRPYRKHRPGPLSSSLYNTLDAKDKRKKKKKKKATEGRVRRRVCRMCWENRAQWYIADEYFKGSSVIWREEEKWRQRRSLKEIRTWGRTLRLIPEEEHSFRVFFLYVSVENAALLLC